jgi:hypothetical protein
VIISTKIFHCRQLKNHVKKPLIKIKKIKEKKKQEKTQKNKQNKKHTK